MAENANEQQQQGQDNNKVEKQYQNNLTKLVAILGGQENLNPARTVKADALTEVVEELLKEQKEKVVLEIKEGFRGLLEKNVQFNAELKKKKQELAQIEVQGKKNFNEAANKIFSKISDIDNLAKQYRDSLGSVADQQEE